MCMTIQMSWDSGIKRQPRDTPDPMSSVVDLGWGHAAGKVKSHNYVKSETFTSPGGTEE